MSNANEFARCPYCAVVLEVSESVWRKVWPFGAKMTVCRSCRKPVSIEVARIMGEQFGYWARRFHTELSDAVKQLPILSNTEALRAMMPGLELGQVRSVPTFESLAHFAGQVYRPVLTDKAHGREARLEIVMLPVEEGPLPPGLAHEVRMGAVAVLGRTSPEAGERETELLVARVAHAQYLTYLPPTTTPRTRDAMAAKRLGVAKVGVGK